MILSVEDIFCIIILLKEKLKTGADTLLKLFKVLKDFQKNFPNRIPVKEMWCRTQPC